ncbi:MAG: transposase [Kiritimatiellae bacterium]|nr:transposase [Verrucomicrobiota bacterium]MBU4291897.1 transposase [Verrucomicrobiota bacterium]MCG2680291.1 transposase [Kiritimatiellia bacterium]
MIYNWWNIFTRLARPDQHMEAITSRPLLLHAVGRLVTTGRRKIIRLTSTHAMSDQIRRVLNRIGLFLNRLAQTAEQLTVEATWAIILSVAFVKWLRGKVLHPVAAGNQMLIQLA